MARQNLQAKKDDLLQELVNVRRRILERCRQFDQTMVGIAFVGHWSVIELLAHLSGWDLANREAAQALLAGRLPAFNNHHGKDWAEFNRILVERHRRADLQHMLADVEETHKSLIAFLKDIPADEFVKDRGLRFKGYKVLLSRLLAAEAEDEADHLDQIEAFLSQQDGCRL